MLVPAHRPALYLPQQLSHMQRTGRRERGERRPDNLADTGSVHEDVWGEINKQMFLMKQEALSTQRGFGLFRQTRLWPAGYPVRSQTQMKVINETRRQ